MRPSKYSLRTICSIPRVISGYGKPRHAPYVASRSCASSVPKFADLLKPTTSNPQAPPADHRTLGKQQDLFSTTPYSPGSPLLHPDGAHVFHKLQSFLRAQYEAFGIQEVVTPILYKQSLWELSGHWQNYKDDMFEVTGRGATGHANGKEVGEDEKYGLKPMNCPGHCLLFKSEPRSYRDLPVRYADFGPLHRNEISGALSGLTRVRRFHQDDGHIFCRPDQVGQEIANSLTFVSMVYDTFNLGQYKLALSTRPKDHFIGKVEEWNLAEAQLKQALDSTGREWEVSDGDGAFYGPKIDIILKDSDGKEHQTATIQLDFQLPQRFNLVYKTPSSGLDSASGSGSLAKLDTDGDRLAHLGYMRPVLIHRAALGSLERFLALLIEHYRGHWPFWLSPRQAIILTIGESEDTTKHAASVASQFTGEIHHSNRPTRRSLNARTFAVDMDLSGRSIGKKMSEAKRSGYNLICVIGPEEAKTGSVTVDITGTPQEDQVIKCLEAWPDCDATLRQRIRMDQTTLLGLMKLMADQYL